MEAKRIGQCKKCGDCCRRNIISVLKAGTEFSPGKVVPASESVLLGLLKRFGFNVLSLEARYANYRWWFRVSMLCDNLTRKSKCGIWPRRPNFCRAYPSISDQRPHRGCGFRWKKSKVRA